MADLRESYRMGELAEGNCETNPIVQFERWFKEAQAAHLKEPNAMVLSTVSAQGKPSGRVVLLKQLSEIGFVFYTNYASRKGRELKTNPFASLTFYWPELERQVRVEGEVTRVSREQSEAYFGGRPKGSRLGAWVSHQSEVVPNRFVLEAGLKDLEARYADRNEIPTPEFWGGYCLLPDVIEFWQGRVNRLHDRIVYRRKGEEEWTIERLAP